MDLLVPSVVGIATIGGLVVIAPTVKFALDLAPFLYTNTRCSARNGLLLSKKEYDDLISAGSRKEAFALLEETPYSKIVEHAKYSEDLGESLSGDMKETYQWLEKIVPQDMVPLIRALSLKFEVREVKNVINSINLGNLDYSPKDIRDPELRIKLEEARDFGQVTQAFEKSSYRDIFADRTIKDMAIINFTLDKMYYEKVLATIKRVKEESVKGAFMRYWRTMIDIANIRVATRNMKAKDDIPMISGGIIDIKQLADLTDIAQLETILSQTPYAEHFKKYDSKGMEHAFHLYLKVLASELQAKYTLKSGTVVKFIILKELEIRNLRIILKLKREGFKPDEVKELVVI